MLVLSVFSVWVTVAFSKPEMEIISPAPA